MAQFHTVTVTGLQKTIRDAVVVTLKPEEGDAFEFIPGQYLTFKRDFEGEELRRSYSICSGKENGSLQVGIKRVDGGAFSTWANTELQVGDKLDVMAPMGNFYSQSETDDPHYLGFAAGSGITPVLSILRSVLASHETARFTLVYANRNTSSIMFREELEDLKNAYMGRFNLIHVLNDGSQEIDLFSGRVDAQKCAELFENWIDLKSVSIAFICGPEQMMHTISDSLLEHGLDKKQIRYELFGSSQPGRLKQKAPVIGNANTGTQGRVTLNGVSQTLDIAADVSLLEAALKANLDAPHACKAGVCSTCKCKIVKGEVEMMANHALEDYEVEAGFVLSCQSYPVTETVEWDYDPAGH